MWNVLTNRSFYSLSITQFLGAFNDNALKQIFMLLAVSAVLRGESASGYQLQAAATALFALPFLMFSSFAGELADRFSKQKIIRIVKCFEVFIMIIAGLGIFWNNFGIILLSLFLLSAQSTFFSPAKYGVIPELLPGKHLSHGNGVIQTLTYIAILTGTAMAGLLLESLGNQRWILGLILVFSSLIGFISSLGIEWTDPADPERGLVQVPFQSLRDALTYVLKDPFLFLSMIGFSYVWFAGSVLMININVYGLKVMGLSKTWTSLMIVTLAGGLGAGCLLAGRWSGNRVEPGLVPLGALGMGSCLLVFINTPGNILNTAFWLFMSGLFGGLFLIPLQTTLQERPNPKKKGSVLGTTNVFSFTAVLVSAAFYVIALDYFAMSSSQIMGIMGGTTLFMGLGTVLIVPRFFVRFILWLLVHTIYRVRVRNHNNIPEEGPALLVANHVSYVDGLLLGASMKRFVRFLTFAPLFDVPALGSFLNMMKMIPVDPRSPAKVKDALEEARRCLKDGEVVCIFAEGQITRTGQLLGIRRGVEELGAKQDVPVIPVHLDEVWGSIFSYEKGRFFWKLPKKVPYPVTISFGSPVDGEITRTKVRESIQSLGAEASRERVHRDESLPTKFIRNARRNFWRMASVDSVGVGPVSFGKLLVMSLAMAIKLKSHIHSSEQRVGVLIPPSVGGAVVNLALAILGVPSVNLNYTTNNSVMQDCADQADLDQVVTSKKFLEKQEIELSCDYLMIEELKHNMGLMERIYASFLAILPPTWSMGLISEIESNDDVVTVIFSSGSTGKPKGVKLTHANILANVQSLRQVGALSHEDRMMAILPFFHSFGYTGGLWLPVILGIGTCYHYDPMDSSTIGQMMGKWNGTMMIGTPTFFRMYTQRCDTDQFSELRLPICGAEKLKQSVAENFYDKFNVWPLEGYGCTEMAPAVSVNLPDIQFNGNVVQKGRKLGSVGRPLPGVAVRIVDPDDDERLPDGDEGLILARGANRMDGYLDRPSKTEEAIRGEWYVTGDIGRVDKEGFLHITDRLARFSKIGGEMVPHVKIEETLTQIANNELNQDMEFAVTGVTDDKKGEQLVVLHTGYESNLDTVKEKLKHNDLPQIWIPSDSNYYSVEEIPKLGTGTMDIQGVKEKARKLMKGG